MIGIARGVITLVLMLLFIALALWAWSSRRKEEFESMARMPLEEDADPAAWSKQSPAARSKRP
jgi:cytochrome c oxidase cbb3-type subunit 4